MTSFNDDPLRIFRFIRFTVTKGFQPNSDIFEALENFDLEKLSVVSTERMRDEVYKMFNHDTLLTIKVFNEIKNWCKVDLIKILTEAGICLKPTMEKK